MAQFIELLTPGGGSVFLRCNSIERVECDHNTAPEAIASPQTPLRVVVREGHEKLNAYGCSVLDILHAIHRDDVFLDLRSDDPSNTP